MSKHTEAFALKMANVIRTREDMHAYQSQIIVPFLRANPFSMLLVDMGLGKSVSTATVIVDLLKDFLTDKVLIIGPLKVVTDTWPTEFTLWEHLAHVNYTLLREDDDDPRLAQARAEGRQNGIDVAEQWGVTDKAEIAKQAGFSAQRYETAKRIEIRESLARSRASIHIINREQVEWLVNFHKEKWPYRTVIIDESSAFKDHTTTRFKALAKVRNTPGLIRRMHLLTATPAAETYLHLFAQIYLLDRGEAFGKHITKYRERYFTQNRYTQKWALRPGGEEDILKKIAHLCLVMRAKDYLPMDEPTFVPRYVRLSDTQMALYEEMKRAMIVELPDGTEVEAETAAALSSKLLQMASGVLYETYKLEDHETGDFSKVRRVHQLHDHKIEMLEELVEELDGAPLLVAYHHKSTLARLKKAFPKAVAMDREGKCIKAWNAGKIPMLLIHPQSGGHGLNLQAGGHHLAFFDLPWSLENYIQLIGRLARQGQKHPVMVWLLISKGTIDETVWSALQAKNDAQELLFTILKRLIRQLKRKRLDDVAALEHNQL